MKLITLHLVDVVAHTQIQPFQTSMNLDELRALFMESLSWFSFQESWF